MKWWKIEIGVVKSRGETFAASREARSVKECSEE
jgi:hypothetical protein